MQPSKHNIISKIKDSNDFFMVNPLSGNADILTEKEVMAFQNGKFENTDELMGKGYIVDPLKEQMLFNYKYIRSLESKNGDEIQIFFVPNYSCNFACSYCYQDMYEQAKDLSDANMIDAFFNYISDAFKDRQKYITIFGGEPLLASEAQKQNIKNIISKAKIYNLGIAVVTNGYHLTEYIDILKQGIIREIQVTLDGTKEIHDKRRFLKNKSGTFDKIVEGIDACIDAKLPVNLRIVVDKENIDDLPALAKFAISKGWTNSVFFKTQLGRNYELHHCQEENSRLFTRIEMYENIYNLIKKYPEIIEFHKPAFSISKFIFENEELPEPLFDSCPACKTEWAFDYTGKIYSCTATVGKDGEELGTFYPQVFLDENKIKEWQQRDITCIKECKECSLQLACGGGCGSVAKNQTGKIASPDCRPVKELLELGFSLYAK
ncbi:MAG: hypothetical protein A2275_17670 [Bacteroidetes bacterium RIFOXYA12_FULL_35_11]|nr:MAG: hypothetical protein A2X01_20195 [Bacteroidetes bacterium GWF2_35_48]OFY78584.1 MAG: hypothetical protein A2275_17670 [Bacteroidetes bacterium RIFOXYA12_FULL_35_11]OFZ03938.1 MAG: hypothetical protein A2491_08490 [Bacteroidetes bacterium RIFOXYC12_FULL_35_7]HBX52842.1 radical SAM/SPASM domain-containing protein [Bacteroidales bacterium]